MVTCYEGYMVNNKNIKNKPGMVLILDGSSEIDDHVRSNLC